MAGWLLFCAGALPAQSPRVAADTTVIAVEDDADPWSRADGTGFANDVVRAAFRAVGIEVRFVVVPYARCRRMVIDGAVVGCFSMSHASDLDGAVDFPPAPLLRCEATLIAAAHRPLTGRTLDALAGQPIIGTVLGYEYPPALETAQQAGRIRVEESPSEVALLRKLAAGRIAAAVLNLSPTKPLAFVAARAGVAGPFEAVSVIGELPSYLGFSRRHPRAAEARAQFARGVAQLQRNGQLQRIERAWRDSSALLVPASAPLPPRPWH